MFGTKQKEDLKSTINKCLFVIRSYQWLLDLYVLDYFIDHHWSKLPPTWKSSFQDMDPADLCKILLGFPTNHMLPLSFLSLIKTVKTLSISREIKNTTKNRTEYQCLDSITENYSCATQRTLKNLFLKHVKLKKRHEISLMAEVVKDVAAKSKCEAVIDFGSGLGHLVRVLAYKNNFYAAGIECQTQLTAEARKLDQELEYNLKKSLSEDQFSRLRQPLHYNTTLLSEEQLHRLPLPATMLNHGLVGLHPCGDLGPLLLKHFVNNPQVRFICVVGCCYMKLTGKGYPMSGYLMSLDHELSFVMTEISCHALEVYCERLKRGDYQDLKIHAYRAALERVLVGLDPELRHAPVRSIKHTETMNFQRYCSLALEKLQIPVPSSETVMSQAERDLSQWRRVVVMYTLRLSLAPLIETLVLLDRVLYILEHGFSCEIRPVFEPRLSPRNHIIIGRRS